MSGITTDQLHDAIINTCRDHFGVRILQYGDYQPRDQDTNECLSKLETPALLLRIDDQARVVDPDEIGEGKHCFWMEKRFALYGVLSIESPGNFPRTLMDYADAISACVYADPDDNRSRRGNRWGLDTMIRRPENVTRDVVDLNLSGRSAIAVTWTQMVQTSDALPF